MTESPTGRGSDFDGDLPQVVGQIMKVSEGASEKKTTREVME